MTVHGGVYRCPREVDWEELFAALGLADGLETRHRFEPHGLSLVRVRGGESAAVHTWPEHGVCTLDLRVTHPNVQGTLKSYGLKPVATR